MWSYILFSTTQCRRSLLYFCRFLISCDSFVSVVLVTIGIPRPSQGGVHVYNDDQGCERHAPIASLSPELYTVSVNTMASKVAKLAEEGNFAFNDVTEESSSWTLACHVNRKDAGIFLGAGGVWYKYDVVRG